MSTFDELQPGELIVWRDGNVNRKARIIERTERCGRMCLIVQSAHKNGDKPRNTRRVFRHHKPVRYVPDDATAAAVIQG